ncbi:MAG: Rhomboid protease GluP [Verrucomicrobiota bacterium]|jgi:membrane associated rhomboid family serine protease
MPDSAAEMESPAPEKPAPEELFEVRFVREPVYPVAGPQLQLLGPGELHLDTGCLHLVQGGAKITAPLDRICNVLRREIRLQFEVFTPESSFLCVLEAQPQQAARLQELLPKRLTAEMKLRLDEDQSRAARVSPLFDRRPGPSIILLLAANLLVFAWILAQGADPMSPAARIMIDSGSNFGLQTLAGEPWRLLSSTFLHFGLIHLAVNMLALWNLGRFLERAYGSPLFLILYLSSGIFGSMLSVGIRPDVHSAGASGAICGLGGALLAFCLLRRKELPSLLIKDLRNHALQFIGLTALIGLAIPGIDNFAHLGGFLGGLVLGAAGSLPIAPSERKAAFPLRLLMTSLLATLSLALAGYLLQRSDGTRTAKLLNELDNKIIIAEKRIQTAILRLDQMPNQATRLAVAADLEKNCLPPLLHLLRQCDALNPANAQSLQKYFLRIQSYLLCRKQEVQLRIQALRQNDSKAWTQADDVLKSWQSKAGD